MQASASGKPLSIPAASRQGACVYVLCGVMVRASEDVRCCKKVREVFSMMMAARF
jgi:hypothetical protein